MRAATISFVTIETEAKLMSHIRFALLLLCFVLLLPKPKAHSQDLRSWVAHSEKPVASSDTSGSAMLFQPLQLRLGTDGSVYVLDFGQMRIVRYDGQGRLLRSYGKGRGYGPGEFANPTDFAVSPSGRIWVVDPVSSRLTIFAADGSDFETVRLASPASRLAVHPSERTYVLQRQSASNKALFEIRSAEDHSLLQEFGQLIRDQAKNSMAVDGRLDSASDGIYYSTTFAGRIMKFTWDGERNFEKPTVDPTPLQEVIVDEAGGRRMGVPARAMALHVDSAKSQFGVMSVVPAAKYHALDVYTRDGEYKYSIRLPRRIEDAAVRDSMIYVLLPTRVEMYSINTFP